MPKRMLVNKVAYSCLIETQVFQLDEIKRRSTETCIHASPSFLLKHCKPTHTQNTNRHCRVRFIYAFSGCIPQQCKQKYSLILNDSQQLLGLWTVEVKCPSPPLERTKLPLGDVKGTKFQEASQHLG